MGIFSKLKMRALSGADRVLDARGKLLKAIEREQSTLQRLIAERVSADRAVMESETTAALGEAADVAGAHARAQQVMAGISRQSIVLAGLRARLAAMASEIESEGRAVRAALPSHIEKVASDFAFEWAKGVAAFGALLGKRRAIEALIGSMDLSDPQPIAFELPAEISGPWSAVTDLTEALEEMGGWLQAANWPAVDAMSPGPRPSFDPSAVYALTSSRYGFEAGTAVMECSLVPGALHHLVAIGDAVPVTSQNWEASLQGAHQAAAQAAREDAASRRRLQESDERRHFEKRAAEVPIAQQRPNLADDPEYKRAVEMAANRPEPFDPNPPTVATIG